MPYDGRLLAGVTVLMAVVEAGSITRAAEALSLTPSGVGRAVQRLEARIGVRLLDRTTRSLRLTDEGRRFWERVGPLLDGISEAALEAAGSAERVRGRLRVNVDPFVTRLVIADRLSGFLSMHRELRLELVMRDHVGDLVADGFDMALRFGDPPAGSFTIRKLMDTRILTVASPAYLAEHGRPGTPRTSGTMSASTTRNRPRAGRSAGSSDAAKRSSRSPCRRGSWSRTSRPCSAPASLALGSRR